MRGLRRTLLTLSRMTKDIPDAYNSQCNLMQHVALLVESYTAMNVTAQQLTDTENKLTQLEQQRDELTGHLVQRQKELLDMLEVFQHVDFGGM